MKFLAFAASHRPTSYNRKLIGITQKQLSANHEVDVAEYGDFDMPIYDDTKADKKEPPEHALAFAKRAKSADGLIISLPEYNWSYPGSLKNIIDWISIIKPAPMAGKTVLLMSASPSPRGGILGLDHIKSPLDSLQMFVFPKVFSLGNCTEAFDDTGHLKERKQSELITTILNDYVTFTGKLSNH